MASIPAMAVNPGSKITVASYYFGNYHPGDPRNAINKGPEWSEWELVKNAKPRFPGHQQPRVPLWGYEDESDPKAMARKIAAADDHGIDAFIFDWYDYNDGPFLDSPIDQGFLKAKNRRRLKFAFMWANHDWQDIHPYHRGAAPKLLYPGKVTPQAFDKICDHLIKDYFVRPNYWRIEGKPYFSFYDLNNLVGSFGSLEATRAALDRFRAKAVRGGFARLASERGGVGKRGIAFREDGDRSPRADQGAWVGFRDVLCVGCTTWGCRRCRPTTTGFATVTSTTGLGPRPLTEFRIFRTSRWAGTPARVRTSRKSMGTSAIRLQIRSRIIRRRTSRPLWRWRRSGYLLSLEVCGF